MHQIVKILAALALGPLSALAHDDHSHNEIEIEPKRFSSIMTMIRYQVGQKSAWGLKEITRRMQSYGCHCFPKNSKEIGGAGPPQDQYRM